MNEIIVKPSVLETFLQNLGRYAHRHGAVYLVGGAALVHLKAKAATLDIDLNVEGEDAFLQDIDSALEKVRRTLNVHIEFVTPHHYLPLPPGAQERRQFVGRFGPVDVFIYDLYSTALAKLSRGHEKDFEDVQSLIGLELIDMARLERYYTEMQPRFDKLGFQMRRKRERLERNWNALKELLSR